MKKLALPLLTLLALVACKKGEPTPAPQFTFVLTNQMVKVENEVDDYLVQVNNTDKTIYIELAYADKAELAALGVKFVSIPSDVTVTPEKFSFNFSAAGASKEVAFKQNGIEVKYTVTASAAKPEPHFVSVKLNGIDVVDGSAKLKGSADLTKVSVAFVVSPENTVVKVNGVVIESATEEAPNEIDFSDKINGVKFSLSCEDVVKEETVKVVTTGINKVNRIWGRYVKPVTEGADAWWATEIPNVNQNMRTMSMDNEYIYLATTTKKLYAVKIADPNTAVEMDMGEYAAGGVFGSCALACMEDGEGGYVTLLSNMVNNPASGFVIWKWDSVSGKPTKVLDGHCADGSRIGDQMSVEGTWKNGKIWFHDFTTQQAAYVYTVTDGVINATPTKITYDAKQGNWSAIYKYDDTQYIGGGPGAKSRLFTLADNAMTTQVELPGAYFANPLHGIRFFTFNEQEYMTYAVLRNSFQDGQMRITELNGETLKASLEEPGATMKFGIGDPVENDITADKNGNGLGNNVLRVIGDKIYIATYIPGAGLSVFTIE